MLIKVLAPGYFSRQDMKTPVRIGMISIAANIVMKLLFVAPLYAYFALGHVGLALSTALAAYVNAYLLYRGLRRAGVYNPDAAWWMRLLRYGAANIVMALVLFGFLQHWDAWQTWSLLERAGHLVIICILGGLSYLISLLLVGVRLQEFRPQS
jgi:putative peptidoglycan lipid II flippase